MKRFFRLLATLLSIALFICAVPQSVLAQIGDLLDEETATESETSSPEVYVLGEVIESRTETTKTFRLSDGSFIAADYGKTVHYADENGAWTDYDNTWQFADATADEDMAGYENKAADVRIKLANNSNSSNLLKLTFGEYKVSMHLVDADKSKALELYPATEKPEGNDIDAASTLHKFSSGAVYKDILPDVDLEYIISGGTVKENIIIKDTADSYIYTFELKLHGLTPSVDTDGNILLQDETTGETQLIIPAGYMYDANGAYSDAVSYDLTPKNGKKYTLTVTADADWVNADERAFPVTVDPTIHEGKYLTDDVDDGFVYEGDSALNTGSYQFVMGGYGIASNNRRMRAFFKLNNLPTLPDSAVIVEATLNLHQLGTGNGWKDFSGTANQIIFAARKVTSSWTETSLCWNTQPSVDSTVLDYNTITASTAGEDFKWDITSVAQGWYNGEANNGIALYPITEYNGSGTYASAGFYSVESPYSYNAAFPMFTISYRDTKGLEDIWTYSGHGAGNAGSGYVNGFNGNLVFMRDDTATPGSVIPILVSHVYNSAMANTQFDSSMPVGKGWKLSVQETLTPYEIDDEEWYRYNDADGTDLYFKPENGKYISEDGHGLTVEVSGNEVTMTNERGDKKVFDSAGKILRIEDVYGNQKLFEYDSDKLEYIKYVPKGETTQIEQLEFIYNNAGALTEIRNSYNSSEYLSFLYSSTGSGTATDTCSDYLRLVVYNNTNILTSLAEYTYNPDGTLHTAKDRDTGYTVTYAYQNNRVISVTESVGTENGQTVGFTYANKQFTVRTSGKDDVYGNTDDICTTALFDHFGKTVCAYSHDVNGGTVYGTSYAEYTVFDQGKKTNNKLKAESVKGITNENLIPYSSGESLVGWTDETAGTGYSAAYSTEESYLGNGSLKLQSTSGGAGGVFLTDSFTVPTAGTYTLSAYVKITGASSDTNGLQLLLDMTSSEKLTAVTNESIDGGWRRISVTKTLSAGTHTVDLSWAGTVGTAYVDCIQLEKSGTPSEYNMITNGTVRNTSGWSGSFGTLETEVTRGHVGSIGGSPAAAKSAYQTITVNAPQSTTFMLTGWARANSVDIVPEDGITTDAAKANRKFGMRATLTYSNGSTEEHYVSFNPDVTAWQYASLAIVPNPQDKTLTVKSIKVAVVYEYNANTMYFDDICLTVEPAQTYVYDENGNLKSATDIEGNDSLLNYYTEGEDGYNVVDAKDYTTVTGDKYEYTYHKRANGTNTHDVETVIRTVNDITQTFTYGYDEHGNVTTTTLTASGTSETFTSSANYTDDGNFLTKITDSLGHVTTYNYDETTKLLKFIEDANSRRTGYKYDNRNRTTNVYLDSNNNGELDEGVEPAVEYIYAQNRYSNIKTASTTYTLTYDTFGNKQSIKAGNNTLVTYEYAEGNGKLLKLTYGNGNFEKFSYDLLDRLTKVVYNGVANSGYELQYDANGRLFQTIDREAGITHTYEYDSLGRLIRAWQKNTSTGSVILGVENSYDSYGRASGSTYVIGNTEQSYGITYKEISGLLDTYTTPHNSFTYSYDNFDRLTRKLGDKHSIQYTYVNGSQRVNTYTISQATAQQTVYAYTYDNLGNITSIKKNGTTVSNYEYDKLGRLIREDDCASNVCRVYSYDKAGNLLNKYEFPGTGPNVAHWMGTYPYVGEIVSTYTYSTSAWGDLLTNYNGTTINYDAIGNPLNWNNILYMGWEGRNLVSLTEDMLNHGVFFEYNADGIRTKKTLADYDGTTTTHDYILDGSTILGETIKKGNTTTTLYYYYDESGISGISYNGTKYSYVRNLQGDVIAILNSYGGTAVEYKYDAWGNILSVTGALASTLGAVNPFRYRGYYYDTETEFYYLNSRYYDPQVGRFLNADEPVLLGANGGIMGYNMFAYCNNNPVCFADSAGNKAYCVATPDGNNQLTKMSSYSSRGGMGYINVGGFNSVPTQDTKDKQVVRYDVPLYTQGYMPWCGMCCQLMISSYRTGNIIYDSHEKSAILLAMAIRTNGKKFYKPMNPNNMGEELTIESIEELYDILEENGPVYAYYTDWKKAHMVVVTGVDIRQNIVYTNNPWGFKGEQTFEEFKNGPTGTWLRLSFGMKLEYIYLIEN